MMKLSERIRKIASRYLDAALNEMASDVGKLEEENASLEERRNTAYEECSYLTLQSNSLRKDNAALLEALEELLDGRPTEEPPNEMSYAHRNWVLFEKGREAIRNAS